MRKKYGPPGATEMTEEKCRRPTTSCPTPFTCSTTADTVPLPATTLMAGWSP
jgi:hypothetical protein